MGEDRQCSDRHSWIASALKKELRRLLRLALRGWQQHLWFCDKRQEMEMRMHDMARKLLSLTDQLTDEIETKESLASQMQQSHDYYMRKIMEESPTRWRRETSPQRCEARRREASPVVAKRR